MMTKRKAKKTSRDPSVGGLSFEPVSDTASFTDIELATLIGRVFVTGLFCAVVGGVILTGIISAVAAYFQAPEFADIDYLGFVLGGVVGLLIAAFVFANALRQDA